MTVKQQEWDQNPHGSNPKDEGTRTPPGITTRDLNVEKGKTVQDTPNSLRKGNTNPAQPSKGDVGPRNG